VDRRRLKEWQNKKDEIEAMKYKRNTFKIKSRKDMSRFPDMETRLYAWVMENRIKGVCIGGLAFGGLACLYWRIGNKLFQYNPNI
jgi:hypothetical protein